MLIIIYLEHLREQKKNLKIYLVQVNMNTYLILIMDLKKVDTITICLVNLL